MERVIITVNAKNKLEAIAGLEMVIKKIKDHRYSDGVNETVAVTDEGEQSE